MRFLTLVLVPARLSPVSRAACAAHLLEPHRYREELGGKFDSYTLGGPAHDPSPDVDVDVMLLDHFANRVGYALVTPDGVWHERGDDETEDDWVERCRALIEPHADRAAVTVSCHA